ncbi:MAG: DUF4845 domain-containing protein [Betaproteobacteria bacterium]|nr:DUF4845 domain-containing protein [Betaproteobacteria bacterium]
MDEFRPARAHWHAHRLGYGEVMRKQRGLSLIGLIFFGALLFFVALIVMKAVPTYIEYFSIRNHVKELAKGTDGTSVREIQSSFDRRASIDDITAIQGKDLEVSKDANGGIAIDASYSKKVPLFGDVSLCFDFDIQAAGR